MTDNEKVLIELMLEREYFEDRYTSLVWREKYDAAKAAVAMERLPADIMDQTKRVYFDFMRARDAWDAAHKKIPPLIWRGPALDQWDAEWKEKNP